MATAPAPAANIAAAIQAGTDPLQAQRTFQRSQYLAEVLRQMAAEGGQNIRSPAQLGLNLLALAIAQRGKSSADQGIAQIQQQIAARLFPNDPRGQLLYLSSPGDMAKSAAAAYAPMSLRQGNTVVYGQGGPSYTAPVLRDDGGQFGNQTPEGFTPTGQRAPNYQEATGQQNAATQAAAQAETARHNPVQEAIDRAGIPIRQAEARAALAGAGAAVQNANTGQANSPMVAPPPGYRLVP